MSVRKMKVLERLARYIVTGDPTDIDGDGLEVEDADILAGSLILNPPDGYKFVRFAMDQGEPERRRCALAGRARGVATLHVFYRKKTQSTLET